MITIYRLHMPQHSKHAGSYRQILGKFPNMAGAANEHQTNLFKIFMKCNA